MKSTVAQGVSRGAAMKWPDDFQAMWRPVAAGFPRHDTCRRAEQYIRGLLGRVERKNGWQLAEYAGESAPYALQHILDRAAWDADRVCGPKRPHKRV